MGGALALWIALGPLEGVPHVQDEVVYTLQARDLLAGGLGSPTPSPGASHSYHFLLDRAGVRYGVFPPGWPALLALGVAVGWPALVNPILHGLTVLLGARVAARLGGATAGWLAAPLLALSPQLLLQGASRMSHVLCGLIALAACAGLDAPLTRARAAGVGALIGALGLVRYLDGAVLLLVAAPALWRSRGGPAVWSAFAAPLLAAAALVVAHNQAVTGLAGVFPVNAYFDAGIPPSADPWWRYTPGCNRLGFGQDRGCFPTYGDLGHTPAKALQSLWTNLVIASRLWVGLPLSLGLLAVACAGPSTPQRRFARRGLLLWLVVAAAYALYWVPGLCYGARFHHLAAPMVLVACALGAAGLLAQAPRYRVAGLLLAVPMVWRLALALPELPGYWGVDGRFATLQAEWEGEPAVVLVALTQGASPRLDTPETTGGGLTAWPQLRRGAWVGAVGPLVLAEYHPELIRANQARYPGRRLWLYQRAERPEDDRMWELVDTEDALQVADLPLPVSPVLLPEARP